MKVPETNLLMDAIQGAARDLPEFWGLTIEIERGALSVSVSDDNGELYAFDHTDEPLDETLSRAVGWAIEKAKERNP